ncbi:BRO-N domain-containing protein [Arsenophonus nasoniae]|uniref:BRO family protein n=1 Tax=Arsenophonus nasoniae TaxID=638 RepID=A0AA95GD13_9GAMM|nr:BRO family protein [Arsenophonus nasoniae]WGL96492.1 BRO family protein [Arsenophonus nasoniae]
MTTQVNPIPFNFESSVVIRVVPIQCEPWFIAKDICDALRLTNSRMALKALDNDEISDVSLTYTSNNTVKQNRKVKLVSESGLYTLILRCRDAVTPGTIFYLFLYSDLNVRDAVTPGTIPYRFRKWVTSEVLPSIRKTGKYIVKKEETLGDLVGTGIKTTMGVRDLRRSRKNAEANAASEIAEQCVPMIISAMRKHQYHYTNDNIMPADMLPVLVGETYENVAKNLQIYALLIELANNGHAVSGAFREVEIMAYTIRECQKILSNIETHANYILTQAKPVF